MLFIAIILIFVHITYYLQQGSSHSIFSSLRNTKKGTRIYVFMGDREQLLIFMKQMRVEQLFEEGKYMVIYVNPETSTYDELGFNLWRKQDLTLRLFRYHPFKTSACLRGEGCPQGPMVKRSQYIRIKNPLHKHFAGMLMVGG